MLVPGQIRSENVRTNTAKNLTTNVITSSNLLHKHSSGLYMKRGAHLQRPEIVQPNPQLMAKTANIQKILKMSRSGNKKNKPPESLEDATTFLLQNISMSCFPTKCFEHEGIFYFSGGTSEKPIADFSSGFAIRKGEITIFTY